MRTMVFCGWLGLTILLGGGTAMRADSTVTDSLTFNRQWAERFFSSPSHAASLESPVALHGGGLPFSFVYGGRQVSQLAGGWKATVRCENAGGDRELRILTLTDPDDGPGSPRRGRHLQRHGRHRLDAPFHEPRHKGDANTGTGSGGRRDRLAEGEGRSDPPPAPRQQRRRRGLAADGGHAGPGNTGRIRPVRRAGQFVVGSLSVLQSPVGWRRRDHRHRLDGAVAGDGRARAGTASCGFRPECSGCA